MKTSRNTLLLLSVALALTATGCSSNHNDETHQLQTIDVIGNANHPDTGNAAEIIETVAVLNPAATDSTLIGYCQIAGTAGDTIYLRDSNFSRTSNMMMTFDISNGTCLSVFDRTGQGPEEYIAPWTAWKTPGKADWTIYDQQAYKIMNYTYDGHYIGSVSNDSISELIPNGNGWVGMNKWMSGNNDDIEIILYQYDTDLNFIGEIATGIDYYLLENGSIHIPMSLTCVNGKPYFQDNDTLYTVNGKEFERAIAFNTGDRRAPRFQKWDEYYNQRTNYLLIFNAIANAKHVLVSYALDGKEYHQIYRRSDGQLLFSRSYDYDAQNPDRGYPVIIDGKETLGFPQDYADDDYFYLMVDADKMAEVTGDEDCNPAFVKIKIND